MVDWNGGMTVLSELPSLHYGVNDIHAMHVVLKIVYVYICM